MTILNETPPPHVEASPDGSPERASSHRALDLRIRQQEILAELGVISLRGAPFTQLLDEAARLTAEGLESEFCKIMEFLPSENHLSTLYQRSKAWMDDVAKPLE